MIAMAATCVTIEVSAPVGIKYADKGRVDQYPPSLL